MKNLDVWGSPSWFPSAHTGWVSTNSVSGEAGVHRLSAKYMDVAFALHTLLQQYLKVGSTPEMCQGPEPFFIQAKRDESLKVASLLPGTLLVHT